MGKKNVTMLSILLLLQFHLFSLDGTWLLTNVYSQYIADGKATIQALHVSPIRRIFLNSAPTKSSIQIEKGKLEVIDHDDKYKILDIDYLDLKNQVLISVKSVGIVITIFYVANPEGEYWYSYSISESDFKKGIINSPQKSDKAFLNLLGIMNKVE